MTEKQKQAIEILNDLRYKTLITKEEYFLLMEFAVTQPQISYIPYYPSSMTTPLYQTYKTGEIEGGE